MSQTILSDILASRRGADRFGNLKGEAREKALKLAEAYNKEAQNDDKWYDPKWQREQAALLAESVTYGFDVQSNIGTWFPTQTVGYDEKVFIRETRGLKAFWVHRGGYVRESQLRNEDFEIPRDTIGFHVSEFEDKLRVNFADSMATMASLGTTRMEAEVTRRIFVTLQAAIPPGSPYYEDASSTGLTPEVLNTAILEIFDNVRPDGQGPQAVTIVGRATAVDQISDFDGYSDEALEEIRRNGRLGTYRAANIQRVTNYVDDDGVPYFPANEVWVVGGNVGRWVNYGGATTRQWSENTADYIHYRTRRDCGGLVTHPESARRIKIAP